MKGFTNYELCITDTVSDTEATFQTHGYWKGFGKTTYLQEKGMAIWG